MQSESKLKPDPDSAHGILSIGNPILKEFWPGYPRNLNPSLRLSTTNPSTTVDDFWICGSRTLLESCVCVKKMNYVRDLEGLCDWAFMHV